MSPLAPLRTPWRSAHRSLRWLTALILLLAVAGAFAFVVLSPKADAPMAAFGLFGAGLCFLWAFFMPGLLLLAIDARKLRLPGVQREIHASLLVYALLSILPATVLAAAAGVDGVAVGLLLALCAAAGLGFAVLPRYLSMWMGFLPALHMGLKHMQVLDLPGPGGHGFAAWAAATTLLLLPVCALCWRRLLHADTPPEGFNTAMVLQFRRRGAWGQWNGNQADSLQSIRQRPDWMQPRADLRGIGPGKPLAAIRVALGHWYTPRTVGGHLRAAAPVGLSLLLGMLLMMLIGVDKDHHGTSWEMLKGAGLGMVGWFGLFGNVMASLATVQLVNARWRKANTELPLLALLPGLGEPVQVKRALLLAILRRPLCAQALLLVVLLAVGIGLHLPALGLLSIAVAQLGGAAVMVACVPGILGGRPLPTGGLVALLIVLLVLTSLGGLLPLMALGEHPWEQASRAIAAVLGAWLALGIVLAWLGRRGWRGFVRRPHAFLVNVG